MRRVFKSFLQIILFFLIGVLFLAFFPTINKIYAHPIDNTDTYIYIKNDSIDKPIPPDRSEVYVYLGWFQVGALVEDKEGVVAADILELATYSDLYSKYTADNISLSANGKECEETSVEVPKSQDEFSMTLGPLVIIKYKCQENIESLTIKNTLLMDYFELPSNYVTVYDGQAELIKETLGRGQTEYTFELDKLDANNPIDESFDYTAGLTQDQVPLIKKDGKSESQNQSDKVNALPKNNNTNSVGLAGPFLSQLSDLNQNPLIIILIVMAIGFLHTMEFGHSKAILASLMIDKRLNVRKGILYALIFTLTHLADILIVGVILFVSDKFFNIYSRFALLEKISVLILFGISLFLLITNIRNYLKNKKKIESNPEHTSHDHNHEHDHGHSHSHDDSSDNHDHIQEHNHDESSHDHGHTHAFDIRKEKGLRPLLVTAFLAGLAPCLVGWAIFMMILSSKSLVLLFPVILAFGVGIFIALVIVAVLIGSLKGPLYNKFEKVAVLSPIISAGLLFAYTLYLISQMINLPI